MALVARIQELSREKGTNIKQLEVNAGIGNGTIRRWDASPPSVDKLLKVAHLLNTSMDYLMTGTTAIPSPTDREDTDLLDLFHMLPLEVQYEIRGEIKGYLKRMADEAEEDVVLPKTGTSQGK